MELKKHHITLIDVFLGSCFVLFIACCIGMTIEDFQTMARIAGLVLVFIFISGLFYATLHLTKVG